MTETGTRDDRTVRDAVAVTRDGEHLTGTVQDGFDVFGIPHGGYLAALGANAILRATSQPDLFTITTHYLRKAEVGAIRFEVTPVAGSRRFSTVTATGTQDGKVVLSIMASVGDRCDIEGPSWTSVTTSPPRDDELTPPPGTEGLPFEPPNIATQMGLRMHTATVGFATGQAQETARMRGVMEADQADQLTAIIACDLTPPAVWNKLGAKGWVPTVELTAHVRGRPAAGPLTIDVITNHVADGFLDEDALVHDAEGRLIVQSRQLARWTG